MEMYPEEIKFVTIDGEEWEQEAPFCVFCGTHMGELFHEELGYKNPNGYKEFDDNVCSGCGAKYEYEEGIYPVFSDEELEVIRKMRSEKAKAKVANANVLDRFLFEDEKHA